METNTTAATGDDGDGEWPDAKDDNEQLSDDSPARRRRRTTTVLYAKWKAPLCVCIHGRNISCH
ncbi:hypothetical protein CVT26_014299 [Gymnopilus dilepis]|uniref:Uncharacterized protein n=1 Tax=Gymnopilus dilepis TaxID=231916 RepID=A0A409Y8H9_9AGAR|nr:hypothetical protein CVT26_014299 [Gymnopilus dilepis]